jgi:hypothetical protein
MTFLSLKGMVWKIMETSQASETEFSVSCVMA